MYGPGGPTDSDFVRLATEHVDETLAAPPAPHDAAAAAGPGAAARVGRRVGREERARLIDATARVMSDTFLRAFLTGQARCAAMPAVRAWRRGAA